MGDLTEYMATLIRDWMSQGEPMPNPPGSLYVSLHTNDPGDNGDNEVDAPLYDREEESNWNPVVIDNEIAFENAESMTWEIAENEWGTVTHVALWDDSGNSLASYELENTKFYEEDDQVKFAEEQLNFKVT